jgi:hypothetical protein
MSKIENRLKKLEKQQLRTTTRYVWVDRGEDGDAKIAELIASGQARPSDEVVQVSWTWHDPPPPKGKRNGGQRTPLRFGSSSNRPSREPTDV